MPEHFGRYILNSEHRRDEPRDPNRMIAEEQRMRCTREEACHRPFPELRRVDIAGTAWPVYKLEALAFGSIVFASALALVGSLQTAVLSGAAVAVATWWTLRLTELHHTELHHTELDCAGHGQAGGLPRQAAGPQ